jgi:hypothetical protein
VRRFMDLAALGDEQHHRVVRSRSGAGEYMANDYAGVVWHSAAGVATVIVDFSADRPLDTLMLFSVDGAAINAATRRSSGLLVLGFELLGRRRHRRGAGDFWAAPAQARCSIRTDWRADRRRDRAGAHLRRRPRYLLLRIAGMTAGGSVQISRIGPASASAFSAISGLVLPSACLISAISILPAAASCSSREAAHRRS